VLMLRPEIIADLEFLATDQGGRRGLTPRDRFKCPLQYDGEYFDCVLDLESCSPISPGERMSVPIQFLCPELIVPRLYVGAPVAPWELRIIARGVVTELSTDPLHGSREP